MADAPTRTAFYLASSPDAVFAQLHEPLADGAGAAVMIVPTIGWGDVASAPIRRLWADRLAADGHPALRIDLPGSGDSGGKPTDPGRVTAWTNAVADAAEALRSRYPNRRVVAIGLGLGGLIAWKATAAGAAIDDLVLWGVPSRGRTLVRELQAVAALKDEPGDGQAPAAVASPAGFVSAGYVVAEETADELSSIDLTELPLTEASARRVLLISRGAIAADGRLRQYAAHLELPLTETEGRGWVSMMSGPHESVLPEKEVEFVADWIDLGRALPVASDLRHTRQVGVLSIPGALERPWAAERDDACEFGVLAEPVNGESQKLAVVLLSGAVSHGPNRMWVECARRWAAQGVPVLRLEVGEDPSDMDEHTYAREAKLYDRRFAVQASDAIGDLVRDGVADRYLVVGLCAAASWAFHAALLRPEVSAAVLINPFVFDWEEDVAISATVGRTKKLRWLDGWRRLVSGDIDPARVRVVASHVVRTPVEWRQRRRRTRARIQRELRDLDRLRDADTRLTFLIGQNEPIVDRLRGEGVLDELHRSPNVTLRRLPTRNHSFSDLNHQALVHRELDAAVARELEMIVAGRMSRREILAKTDSLR